MLYITLLDQFHPGIYSSQVVDVCDYLNKEFKCKIRIVAFLSIKELVKTDARKKLKKIAPNAIVLPAFPGLKNFESTAFFLFFVCLITGERVAICRNAFCTKMALNIKRIGLLRKVVLDGRSSLNAEISEYDVFPVQYLRDNIGKIEMQAVNGSDFRIAVSDKLIQYWKTKYNYDSDQHVVIPCTLDTKHFNDKSHEIWSHAASKRAELGFSEQDNVLVYSGSNAPWQSFDLLEKLLATLLDSNSDIKVLLLTRETEHVKRLRSGYGGRVINKWVYEDEVPFFLQSGDYGILVRETSDTNKVASPVKFAEYLFCGLEILISEGIGDLSEFVTKNKCGYVVSPEKENFPLLEKPDATKKKECYNLAVNYFGKNSDLNRELYSKLVNTLLN